MSEAGDVRNTGEVVDILVDKMYTQCMSKVTSCSGFVTKCHVHVFLRNGSLCMGL